MELRTHSRSFTLLGLILLMAGAGVYAALKPATGVLQLAQIDLRDYQDTGDKAERIGAEIAAFYNQKLSYYYETLQTLATGTDEQKLDRAMKQLIVKNVRAWKKRRLHTITRALDWVTGFKKPFSRYARFVNNDIKQLRTAHKKLQRYSGSPMVTTAIESLIAQLIELREYVYSHDMYLFEKAGSSSSPLKIAFSPLTKILSILV